ncbi:MAG: carbamoyl-phosphate synthase large subunit, partial [Myxococcota bacterium]|nr:carbamoyl-phosphate synthase large subunit [Myxococcota bacterium]
MPRRKDIQKIMVVGSGPIVIGQACEFDYSGTQALKALRQEGYKTVLVNSNPATIMTDPDLADRTYIEPLTLDALELIIAKERPDAFLPTVGGQTALNLTMELSEKGVFEKYEVEVLGANPETIHLAEDRDSFCQAMKDIKLSVAKGKQVGSVEEALNFAQQSGFPVVIRPSFTLGGSGGGIARNEDEIKEIAVRGLRLSRTHEVLIEESLIGWKEYELEVIRDKADNVIVVCSIENIDAMGVHTGDSITVAPAQTLSDKEYQRLRNAAVAILRRVKVDTGGANVQFAIDPASGRMVVIEMNPRVSRSSALASKATGYPIAKVAAKLAVGYTLDELPNDITINTPAAFEPALDYVVTKIPKFTFEKFPGSDMTLGTQMKSVGEVMAIGRTLRESLFKALRSLESLAPHRPGTLSEEHLSELLSKPSENTLRFVVNAFERGWDIDRVARLTFIDPWFLEQVQAFSRIQQEIRHLSLEELGSDLLRMAKENGFSDRRIAYLCGSTSKQVRDR